MKDFFDFCYEYHDTTRNEKYDNTLPYSFHLKCVLAQANKFIYLIPDRRDKDIVAFGAVAHDLIESMLTYNDIVQMSIIHRINEEGQVDFLSKEVANIVYLCTDYKGRNRAERKPKELYLELKQNELALFVKLCDIIANSKYSALQNLSMLSKYKTEYYEKVKPLLYTEKYKDIFNYLEKVYEL